MSMQLTCVICGELKDKSEFRRDSRGRIRKKVCVPCEYAAMTEKREHVVRQRKSRSDFDYRIPRSKGGPTFSIPVYAPGSKGASLRIIGIENTKEERKRVRKIIETFLDTVRDHGMPVELFDVRPGYPAVQCRMGTIERYMKDPESAVTADESDWEEGGSDVD